MANRNDCRHWAPASLTVGGVAARLGAAACVAPRDAQLEPGRRARARLADVADPRVRQAAAGLGGAREDVCATCDGGCEYERARLAVASPYPDRPAMAAPPSCPGRHATSTADTLASTALPPRPPNVAVRPLTSTTTRGLPRAASASRSGSWPPGRSRLSRSLPSPHDFPESPRTATMTSEAAATATASARADVFVSSMLAPRA